MTNHLVCMIQARLDSTRLPGKILEEIDGLPAIMHTTRRVMESRLHPLVICPQKDRAAIVEALRLPSDTWRVFGWDGPEDDVLGRFVAALDVPPFEVGGVIRITADCPWLDISTLSIAAGFLATGQPDFVTTNAIEGSPHIDGYDVEGFTRELLVEADRAVATFKPLEVTEIGDSERSFRTIHQIPDRENVTPWMRRNAKNAWVVHRLGPEDGRRWTLDTPEDLEWFRAVAAEINVQPPEHPTYENLLALEERRPDLIRRNG